MQAPCEVAARQLRADVVDHLDEVRVLQALGGEDPAAARLHQRVLKLVEPVRRVDVDEDHPGLRGRVLGQRPLGTVRAPHADPIALVQARREHPSGEPVHCLAELPVRVADPVAAVDESVGIGNARDRSLEVVPDRLPEQRIRASAVCVGQHLDLSLPPGCRRRSYCPPALASSVRFPRCDTSPSRTSRRTRGRARGRRSAAGSRRARWAGRACRGARRRAGRGAGELVGGRRGATGRARVRRRAGVRWQTARRSA